MKFLKWIGSNYIFIITLFLLAFIPLYPKIPAIGITNTWVYVRLDDFFVAFAGMLFLIDLIRRRVTIKTPLTISIVTYWAIGLISTMLGVIFLFPHLANVFPKIAYLFWLRHIEYMCLFFVGFFALYSLKHKDPESQDVLYKSLPRAVFFVLFILSAAVIGFISYILLSSSHANINQTPLQLSFMYTAYCVAGVILCLLAFRKKLNATVAVIFFTLLSVVLYGLGQRYLGFPAFLTGNEEFAKGIPLRISPLGRIAATFAGHYDLAAYLVMIIPILGSMIFGLRKWWVKIVFLLVSVGGLVLLLMTASRTSFAVYLVAISFMLILQKKKWFIIPVIILSILLLREFNGIATRFSSTLSQVDVVVDARTGKTIGIAQAGTGKNVTITDIQQTGESLPQGSSYIGLPSQAVQTTTEITRKSVQPGSKVVDVTSVQGDFAVKKVIAYDISFTTRFQGEWPRAIDAFKRDYLFGSGYSSISLATDGNYLRILGETGALGFASFFAIFLIFGIYAYRVLPEVPSKPIRSFVIGVCAAIFGLALNAILIDVFEASKDAYMLWILMGIVTGMLALYQKKKIDFVQDAKSVLTSFPAVATYLTVLAFVVYSMIYGNYFVGDDFTWLRWIADCKKVLYSSGALNCQPVKDTISNFFLHSDGFFYRPGAKIYFLIVYTLFWLSAAAYHVSSVFFHLVTAICIYIIGMRIFKNKLFPFIAALFFIVLSGNFEAIFWIASVGHLLAAMFILLALVSFTYWRETKNILFLIGVILCLFLSPLFHEVGVVGPFIMLAYDFLIFPKKRTKWGFASIVAYFVPIPIYYFLRKHANSEWFSGDYSYKLSNLPFNIFGNLLGYLGLAAVGAGALPYYDALRSYSRHNLEIVIGLILIGAALLIFLVLFLARTLKEHDIRTLIFSVLFFVIGLSPFLGLGNLSPRYVYLASIGFVFLVVFILEKLFKPIHKKNNYLAYVLLIFVVFAFMAYHIQQLNVINKDWQKASHITNNLQLSFNSFYLNGNIGITNPVFYFVDTPIKTGTAWIFPVGLPDAMWFTFQNQNLTVTEAPSLSAALDATVASTSARVFQFQKDGSIQEVERTQVPVSPTPLPKTQYGR